MGEYSATFLIISSLALIFSAFVLGSILGSKLDTGNPIPVWDLPHRRTFTLLDTMAGNNKIILVECDEWDGPKVIDIKGFDIPPGVKKIYVAHDDIGTLVVYQSGKERNKGFTFT